MITLTHGDILHANAEALVNTVNCVGFMGRGIAAQFKRAFPANFAAYETACKHQQVQPGRMLVVETGHLGNPKYIINFPTKRHWRGESRIDDIDAGLKALVTEVRRLKLRTIAVPPLGCGLGGLSWSDVRPRIERAFDSLPEVRVLLYEPASAPPVKQMVRSKKPPRMTPGRAVLVGLIRRYLAGLMDPSVSLLEIHKLMYFAQEAGEPLRLSFAKAPYGPYAENLRHVLQAVEGHFLSGYAEGGDKPDKQIALVPGAAEDAEQALSMAPETHHRFDHVAHLVEGFETPFGLELLATVHWVSKHEQAGSLDDVRERVYAWNDRKRRFSPEQIAIALDTLRTQAWLT